MTEFLNWLNGEIIWGPPLIALIIITGIYVTVRSGFFQVCHLGYIFKRTLGCILRKDHVTDENDKGLLSPYEAIATAVGGSVGFGNIAGVATAVTTGGPGAVLWMWLTAFMGMLIKQVEVTLAVYYRRTDEEGNPYGGPTYYMEYGLGEERHWGKKWLPLAFVFGLGIFSTFFISENLLTMKLGRAANKNTICATLIDTDMTHDWRSENMIRLDILRKDQIWYACFTIYTS